MLVLNLPFKALMFLTLMRPSLVLFLVLWLKLVKDFLKVRCRLALLPFLISCLIWLDLVASLDRMSGSAGMPRPLSYAVFCLKKNMNITQILRELRVGFSMKKQSNCRVWSAQSTHYTSMAECSRCFFCNDTDTTQIYTLSLHDALPILFLVLWLKLVKDFLKVRCRLALLPFLMSCLIWLDLVAS